LLLLRVGFNFVIKCIADDSKNITVGCDCWIRLCYCYLVFTEFWLKRVF